MHMDTAAIPSYETILKIVSSWPVEQRLRLVQDVRKTIPPGVPHSRLPTLHRALGLLATDRSAPSDEEIAQWLEEHRLEKYG